MPNVKRDSFNYPVDEEAVFIIRACAHMELARSLNDLIKRSLTMDAEILDFASIECAIGATNRIRSGYGVFAQGWTYLPRGPKSASLRCRGCHLLPLLSLTRCGHSIYVWYFALR